MRTSTLLALSASLSAPVLGHVQPRRASMEHSIIERSSSATLVKEYSGSSFFDEWTFATGDDTDTDGQIGRASCRERVS